MWLMPASSSSKLWILAVSGKVGWESLHEVFCGWPSVRELRRSSDMQVFQSTAASTHASSREVQWKSPPHSSLPVNPAEDDMTVMSIMQMMISSSCCTIAHEYKGNRCSPQ
eukprot:gnl/TRDRNA2_/TRDRNA2_74665_c1_seq1.p1 gnl/TRDRNA2_/TRDRNA2_74665_c1~~gnl/TRDRNA2_/TRDRNA2_74665_c1_seq1.p1  ORF type:complete len:111 (-),score=13.48 gnl/TRDRNA2_/TRDRNA2_74665_c1_seq1:73-405(-)